MIVKPSPGIKVRDPKTRQHLPPEGIRVADDDHEALHHWHRQAGHGDVTIGPDPAPAKAPAKAPKEG